MERHPCSIHREQSVRESPSSSCTGRSRAEQMALPEVRMEPKLPFALAQYGCSQKWRAAGESQRVGAVLFAPRNTEGCTHQPKFTFPPQLPVLSCCPHAPEPEAGYTKSSSCPHPPLGFWKTRPSQCSGGCRAWLWRRPGLQSSPATALWVGHLCSSSGPAPGALRAWQVESRADAGLGCREVLGRGRGRVSWSCNRGYVRE